MQAGTDNYSLLIDKINIFIRKYYFNNFLRGLIFLGAGLFTLFVIVTTSEYFGNFSVFLRTFLFYFFLAVNLGLIIWLIVPSLLAWLKVGKSLTHDEAAGIIGRHFQDVNDKLLNTLQLKKLADADPQHRLLIEASIDQKIGELKPVSFPAAVDIKANKRFLKWLLIPAAVICFIAFAAPSVFTESTKRLIRHNEYFVPAAPFKFVIENHTLSAVQGEDLTLKLKLEGDKFPSDVYIETANNTFKLDKDNISRFHYLFTNLQQNTTFRLTGNGVTSTPYEIRVNLRPSLLHFDAALSYPAYLHKRNETLKNAGDLTIPAGTIVNWSFNTQNATSVLFRMNNKATALQSKIEGLFEHSERPLNNTSYTVVPQSASVKNTDSTSYRINVIADEAPVISVNEKQDSVSSKAIYFDGSIQDDHGFSGLYFHYTIAGTGEKVKKTVVAAVKADLSQTQSGFFYYWDLKQVNIAPGDQVTYYFEVADNDGVNGPKRVRTPERTLTVPTALEMDKQLNAGTQSVKDKMVSAIKIAGQIERESQKLNQALLEKNNLSFDEKKQVESLLQKRKDLNDLVKDIQNENQKNLYNRQENQQQDKELSAKQQQMEQLLKNAIDPKTEEMLQKLQAMLDQEQKDGSREQLSKMQMDNKSLKKELDRMLELYKKLEFEQKLNQNVNQLSQLAQDQQKLAEQTKQPDANKQGLQNEQQKLNNDFQAVKKSLDDLQKANEQMEQKQELPDPKQEEKSIDQKMEQSAEELKKDSPSKAAQPQQQAAKEMKQLADKMKQKEQEGEESENNVDAQQLRELLKNLINSSFEQEKLMQTLKNTNTTDPGYVALSQNQKSIKDNLKTAEDSLYALSRRVPQIQSTVNKEVAAINDNIDKAMDELSERRTPEVTRNQQFAMTSMNNLALLLSEALDQLQKAQKSGKSGKGKGKQQSVEQLAKMQQQLNQNMQKAREQMQRQGSNGQQGKGKSQSGNNGNISEQLAKLARQQQEIREALEQLNQDENKGGAGGLGNLDKIAKQMEQTEHDLVNRRITEEAVKRQEQIQSRLLEAEKAEQQREQDQQRESHAGKEMPPGYIKALQDYRQLKQKQTEQVQTVPPSLNLYYKTKIKSYFDILNAK